MKSDSLRTPAQARLEAAKEVLRLAWQHGTDAELERAHERLVDAGVAAMLEQKTPPPKQRG